MLGVHECIGEDLMGIAVRELEELVNYCWVYIVYGGVGGEEECYCSSRGGEDFWHG
jgi:hypothetical protein